jgi:23S rRNA (pseudouridine1915-N3)-methyltransferase
MKLRLIAVGTRMPAWVTEGFENYQKRLPSEYKFELMSIPPSKRSKNSNIPLLIAEEEKRIFAAIPKHSKIIALDERGKLWNTKQLAETLQQWQTDGQDISFLIGGPDGLGSNCLNKADDRWSLSLLTLPHLLVRIIVVEQLYRAWSILNHHPYHRE